MTEVAPRSSRALLLKLAVVGVVLLAGAVLVARGVDLKGLLHRGLDVIREAGPVMFFLAMAVLPAIGAPLSFFSLTAGSVFGPQIGTPAVVFFSVAAITANMALSYVLAHRAFRPLLESLVKRLGYKMPQVDPGDVNGLIVLIRVTPGIPFPVQNYLLGLAGVPFGRYLLLSALIQLPINAAVVLLGDAILSGKGRVAFIALAAVGALTVGAQFVRKRYAKKKAAG